MRSDSGKLGWSGDLNTKTPLSTEIGEDRGNLEILREFQTGGRDYQFRPSVESFGGPCSKCNSTFRESAG